MRDREQLYVLYQPIAEIGSNGSEELTLSISLNVEDVEERYNLVGAIKDSNSFDYSKLGYNVENVLYEFGDGYSILDSFSFIAKSYNVKDLKVQNFRPLLNDLENVFSKYNEAVLFDGNQKSEDLYIKLSDTLDKTISNVFGNVKHLHVLTLEHFKDLVQKNG